VRVYVEAYGCTQSTGEAHALEAAARSEGHELVRDVGSADVGLLVTCGVVGTTEDRMVRRWRALARRLPHVVVTGCLVPLRTHRLEGPERRRTTFLPIPEQPRLPEILRALGGAPSSRPTPPVVPDPDVSAPVHAEVVLAQGCTSSCSYCFSRLARGRLRSAPRARILAEVASALARGAREIRLSSLDTACWGLDGTEGERLPGLLAAIARWPGHFRVRVGMMSPQRLGPIARELLGVLGRAPFFQFLHLPVQSGSDRVLAAMRRGYRSDRFRGLVTEARETVPGLALATDIIVAFPTEEEDDFSATLRLVEEIL
jgi:threonylcarbamoyladenosine tRNA methylthiotransferase CDKAL1